MIRLIRLDQNHEKQTILIPVHYHKLHLKRFVRRKMLLPNPRHLPVDLTLSAVAARCIGRMQGMGADATGRI